MWNNNMPNYGPFYQAGSRMPQMGSPVQQIQDVQKTAQFYSVNSQSEMESIRPDLNVFYVGMNKTKKEIYVKQLNLDGTVSLEVYNLASNEQKKNEMDAVLEKLTTIERKITDGKQFNANAGQQVFNGPVGSNPTNATSQPNVAGQNATATMANGM